MNTKCYYKGYTKVRGHTQYIKCNPLHSHMEAFVPELESNVSVPRPRRYYGLTSSQLPKGKASLAVREGPIRDMLRKEVFLSKG